MSPSDDDANQAGAVETSVAPIAPPVDKTITAKTLEERKLDLQWQEFLAKRDEKKSNRWSSPLFLSIIAGAVALLGNALALFGNGVLTYEKGQQDLGIEQQKEKRDEILEHEKQQGELILESIRAGTYLASQNLQLLAKAQLIDKKTADGILAALREGVDPGLPNAGSGRSSVSAIAIRTWLKNGATLDISRYKRLQAWLTNNPDPKLRTVPVEELADVTDDSLEAARQRAIVEIPIN